MSADTCPYPISWYTSGDRKNGSAAGTIWFIWIRTWWYISWIALGFVRTFQLQALVIGRFPFLAGNCLGCVVAQTCSSSVPCIPRLSSSAQGVRAGLLQGLTPWTPHLHWPIDLNQPVLLLSVLLQYLEVWVSASLQVLPKRWFFSHYKVSHSWWDHRRFVPWENSSNLLKR